ncbi:MAG: type 4a pilus biogenesis protein PilO [Clostridia bacterium]|nr:type 4a pilus biogenesis protein PilO [Clostridia bacterium]
MPKVNKRDKAAGLYKEHKNRDGFHGLGKSGISTVDIIIIVVAGIVIILSTIFLISNFRTLKKVNQDIEEMRTVISEKQATLDKLIELGNSEDLLKENYERNKLFLPDSKDEIGIISDVTGIIEDEGGKFRSISYGEDVPKESGIMDAPFTIRVDSSFEQLNKIIERFSSTDRLYVIDSIIIIETSAGSTVLSTDIKMHAYYKTQ